MEKYFQLEIITPHRIVFSQKVRHVVAPGRTGYFGILANHLPYLTALQIGRIEAESEDGTKLFATSGGYVEVLNNKMTVLAESAEEASEIDIQRAERARERAEQRLKAKDPSTDINRAKAALLRALNRIQVASHKR